MTPQLLIAGHIGKDVTPDGWHPGGGALYAAAQAARLGLSTAVLTACEGDIEPADLVPDVEWSILRVDEGLRFENTYEDGHRTQRLLSTSTPLKFDDIPPDWLDSTMILLTPVFQDVAPELPGQLVTKRTSMGLGAQGWLRQLDGDRIMRAHVEAAPAWLRGDVVFVSDEDVEEPDSVAQWQQHVPAVVLTRGRRGYTIWDAEGRHDAEAILGCEADPTGAGDVFATAFLARYTETHDALVAARFAAAAASIAVEGRGIEAVGTREQIESRLAAAEVC